MSFIVYLFYIFRVDKFFDLFSSLLNYVHVYRIGNLTKQKIKFVGQAPGQIRIVGNPIDFKIDQSSHLKSNTYIECSGGVSIGRYFHTGSGLTIFSSNHNYNSAIKIPYDEKSIYKSVVIKDFVWCGANVTIVPGVTIGEGVVVGAGAVVTKDIPDYAIVGGNPAEVIRFRDIELFKKLKKEERFY